MSTNPQTPENGSSADPESTAKPWVEGEPVSRRKLLGWMVGILNAGLAAAVGLPTLGFVASPLLHKSKERWVPVLPAGELMDGETRGVTYTVRLKDAYMDTERSYLVFLRRQGDRVEAFDPACPHLGCQVAYVASRKRYMCPCHGAVFAENGSRVSGPAPSGLMPIPAKVEGGQILVRRI